MLPPLLMFPFFSRLIARFGFKRLVLFGCLAYGYAMLLSSRNTTDLSALYMSLVRTALGVGMPLLFICLLSSAMASLPPEKYATGSGIFNFMRMSLGTLGTAAAVSVWDQRTIFHRSRMLEQIDLQSSSAAIALPVAPDPGSDPATTWALIEQLIQQQASTLALNDVLYLSTLSCFAVGVCAAIFMPRTERKVAVVPTAMD
jgi:DHA2 family multidrug resistance protein